MKLKELATVIRSKNASPFITTLDVFFSDYANYKKVQDAAVLTPGLIAQLYRLPIESVLGVWFVEECQGIKISFLKPYPSDHPQSSDLYGAQQNAPLCEVEVD